ncbi:ABC-2 type transporter-domain-containing protein [Aspergillus sergii]|uniref:ABC-2 type transporter-domain-containing protein n=1 Tax=Aspergillus sergii TaxID=1034303 RepID=A0A5N6WTM4_9EURO|nr:ABC-2 type transporter-domain-containing protein [Aspergillus sergii]
MESSTATSSTINWPSEEHKNSMAEAETSPLASKLEDILHRSLKSGYKPRRLGVTWNDLTVKAKSAEATINENVFSQFNILSRLQQHRQGMQLKTILHQSHGCVKPGEMLLVLGRPGSGCTTLLKMLANRRTGYEEIEGDVWYGSMRHEEAAENYAGQIIMNAEEEIFFPTLTVGQTLDFATRLKVPAHLPGKVANAEAYRAEMKEFLLESLRIPHTAETKVGNEYVRGVSGGERKRVSILECLASGASVYCWDNSTRGLDAASALDWAKMMRTMADVHGSSIIATLYQAGNDIFRLFDKVLVLDEGKQIYYGPANEAQRFMESLGFECSEGANIGDYLTSVTVPLERRIRSGYESIFPRNAEAIATSYCRSSTKAQMTSEYDYPTSELSQQRTKDFKESVTLEKCHPRSANTVNFVTQVHACIIRQYQVLLGDKKTFAMKQGSTLIQALVAGSMYYQVKPDTSGLFLKAGALFWSILYNSMSAMSEVVDSFSGRPMVVKHDAFAYCKPAAFCIGQIAADIPITVFQISLWSVILYFMVGLKMSASAFFTYFVVLFACAMCSTALFRAVGAVFRTFDGASKVSGYVVTIMAMYAGFQIQYTQMRPWFGWLYWLNPVAYAFDGLMSNEFRDRDIDCTDGNLIPHGENYASLGLDDEESQAPEKYCHGHHGQEKMDGSTPLPTPAAEAHLARNTSIFTWKNLTYTVKTPSGPRVLLDNVHGWVKPGMLGALMGASGAGKTTLLDVLAQRKTEGKIEGSIMVDGRPLSVSFQRSAGYCEQLDVHEPYATVREALEFSALLRQPHNTSEKEKLEYVDVIIDLLELGDIADTLIGKPNAGGLNIEQRKRVTIGVELVAKPSILIFLDEPTSGLDGQSAFNTMRFLRKLANQGQAILVTIHQPSAQLFYQFDTLLLLAPGGKTVYFGEIGENASMLKEYFERYGSPCPNQMNPADHMIDVVSGRASTIDWHRVWLESPEYQQSLLELDRLIRDTASREPVNNPSSDDNEYATPLWYQTKIVLRRMNIALFRNTNYVNNKIYLHIGLAVFNGFSYWMIGNTVNDMQLRMFTIFVFMFVAPGVVNQLQPLFIERRDIYDAREKKSRMYSWKAFVTALIVSEFPYLCVCGVLYFLCWYYTVGFPAASEKAGAALFVVVLYEFSYTGIGQFVAAYSPNAVFAALVNPLLVGIMVSFCGILVPYDQIIPFWRYWMYYMNPLTYLVGSLLVFNVFDVDVKCADSEFAIFNPPSNMTCLDYLSSYLEESDANLVNPEARSECRVCPYTSGGGYLKTINLNDYYFGWRDVGIFVIFIFSSYGLVYLFMKLRTKASKKAES